MYSRAYYLLHDFLRLPCITVFPHLLPCCVLSCASYALHVFPRLQSVTFSYAFHALHVFPLLQPVACFSSHVHEALGYSFFFMAWLVPGYCVQFEAVVIARKSISKSFKLCFDTFRCTVYLMKFFIGAVTNSQIIQKPLYLDNPPPKSSLPPIQPLKRHVHVPNQSRDKHGNGHSGSPEGESNSDSIRLALKGKLSEVCFRSKIEYQSSLLNVTHFM